MSRAPTRALAARHAHKAMHKFDMEKMFAPVDFISTFFVFTKYFVSYRMAHNS